MLNTGYFYDVVKRIIFNTKAVVDVLVTWFVATLSMDFLPVHAMIIKTHFRISTLLEVT